nr:hypothetical protein [Tanacetum cinerariifolium]
DEETEFAPPVVQIADVDNIPVPPVIQFDNFHVGESLASRDLLEGNDEVCVPGPMPCDLRSVHKGVKRLSKQMHDRYKTEKRMVKILRQEELCRNGQAFDITALDSAVRANTFESSKMMRLITDLSREFSKLKCQNRRAEELSRWEAWVRGRIPNSLRFQEEPSEFSKLKCQNRRAEELSRWEAWVRGRIPNSLRFQEEPSIHIAPVPRADDPYVMVRDAARGTREDEDVETASLWDTQPPESRRSLPAIRDERERVRREATRAKGPVRDLVTAPMARECSFASFMKCDPTQFHGTEGAVGLVRWFEKMQNTFKISECEEVRKVKFATATLHGQALTWWNSQVATLGREVANRLEDELRHLKLRDMNIAAYTERFNELALLCPDVVPNEKKKVELYIKGLPEIIKGETTSSRLVTLNEAIIMENVLPPNGNPNAHEEEPFMDQAPAAFVGFAPQWIGEQIPNNNNGWLEEEPEDEEEEEEEENEAMEDDDEDDAKMINPYEKADPHNRPPPASDEEAEFAPPVVQISVVDNIPVPLVI